ncbi:MAG: hypothetical protein RJB25_309, partial [Bacteroidota bacterium]
MIPICQRDANSDCKEKHGDL